MRSLRGWWGRYEGIEDVWQKRDVYASKFRYTTLYAIMKEGLRMEKIKREPIKVN